MRYCPMNTLWVMTLQDRVSTPLERMQQKFARVSEVLNRLSQGVKRFSERAGRSFRGASQTVEELRQKLAGLQRYRDTKLGVNTTAFRRASREIDQLQRKIDRVEGRGGGGGGSGGMLSMAGRFALPAVAAAALMGGAGNVMGRGLASDKNDFLTGAFMGSRGQANAAAEQLRGTAAYKLYGDSAAQSQRFMYSQGMGEREANRTYKTVGDLAAGSGSDMFGLTRVLGQVRSYGRLQGDELEQFSERNINVLPALAKTLGVPISEVRDQISKGNVTYEKFYKALESMTGKGGIYNNLAQRYMDETPDGKLKATQARLNEILREMGVKTLPVVIAGLDVFNKLLDNPALSEMTGHLTKFGSESLIAIGKIGQATGLITTKSGEAVTAMSGVQTMFGLIAKTAELASKSMTGLTVILTALDAGDKKARETEREYDKLVASGDRMGAFKYSMTHNPMASFIGGFKESWNGQVAEAQQKKTSQREQERIAKMLKVQGSHGHKIVPPTTLPKILPPISQSAGLSGAVQSARTSSVVINIGSIGQSIQVYANSVAEGADRAADEVLDILTRRVQSAHALME